tara:strand:- start:236 stop:571 length:336 start_codon:yes stop_codon:yes gene_type:complete
MQTAVDEDGREWTGNISGPEAVYFDSLVAPGTAIGQEMSRYEQECLWELFSLPGWDHMEKRLKIFASEFAGKALAASRNQEGDRYEIGKYDAVLETLEFMKSMVQDARPGA